MFAIEKQRLIIIFGLLSIGLTPFLFLPLPSIPWEAQYVPLIIVGEVLLYALFIWLSNTEGGWSGACVAATALLFLRGALSIVCALGLGLSAAWSYGAALEALHLGNPLAILFQFMLLMMFAPHLLYPILPGLLSAEAVAAVEGASHSENRHGGLSNPVGGYIQVFSYKELGDVLRKIADLEGIVIYSDEGLPIWSNLGIGVEEDVVTVAANQAIDNSQAWARDMDLSRLDKSFLETSEHFIFNLSVSRSVRMLMLFTVQSSLTDVRAHVEKARKTVWEFLRSRHELEA